jgi:surface carbohydrate biosynthesis protein
MFSKRIASIFVSLIKAKYNLSLPPKTRNLIFDSHSTQLIEKIFKDYKFHTLDTRYETINLAILIRVILKFKFSYRDYLKEYIEFVNPKILITLIDNNQFFYELTLKEGKKISIQNSRRGQISDIFDNLKLLNVKKKNFIDLMFVQNKHVGKLYNKFIKGKTIPFGNIRSNLFKIIKTKKKYDLVYISSGNYYLPDNYITSGLTRIEIIKQEKIFVSLLKVFCLKNNIQLFILGKDINYLPELNFYKEILGKYRFTFIKRTKNRNSYKVTDNCNLLVSMDSTLLYEAFSRGAKCYFGGFRHIQNKLIKSGKFGWPQKLPNKGKFWINYFNEKKIHQGLIDIYRCKKEKWVKISKKYRNDIMIFDLNNTILKKYNKLFYDN